MITVSDIVVLSRIPRFLFRSLIVFSHSLEAEKLCAKCAEKLNEETMSTKVTVAQMPLLITSLQVKTLNCH